MYLRRGEGGERNGVTVSLVFLRKSIENIANTTLSFATDRLQELNQTVINLREKLNLIIKLDVTKTCLALSQSQRLKVEFTNGWLKCKILTKTSHYTEGYSC